MEGESPTKKMVEQVKEIMLDFSDEDIRATLEECGKNPNAAVERLLAQDTFHEVKSKRERRKEAKEMQELKLQGGSNISKEMQDLDAGSSSNAEAISEKSAHMSAPVNGESEKTSTTDNVIVSPRLAEARSYLEDAMRRPEGSDSGNNKTDPSSGGASGCSQGSPAEIIYYTRRHKSSRDYAMRRPEGSDSGNNKTDPSSGGASGCSQGSPAEIICYTRRHKSSRDSDAAGRAMSTSTDNDDGGVLLPSHVQALAAECSNLTLGTYKSKSDPSTEADVSSMQQLCLPEHLLKDILEPANNFSEGNQEELFKKQQDMERNLNSGSNMESSLQYFRRRDMVNSTYPPDESRYNKAVSSMRSQAISIPEQILGADYDKAVKLPQQNYLPSDDVSFHSSDNQRNLISGSNTESSLQYFRRWDMLNSTYPPDESRYNKAVSSMKSQAISIPEQILGADYDKAVKLPQQNYLPSNDVSFHSSDNQRNLISGSNTESCLQYFRQRDMVNSTYPPDESRYNKAVSSMKSQAISIPEQILGADYDKAVKLPDQLIGTATQHNRTLDGVGNCGGFPNTPQNYGHQTAVEEVLHYLAAVNDGRGLPHFSKTQKHPLTSLACSSTDASGFGSSAHSRGSYLHNAPPGFLPMASVAAPSAPPGFLPDASVATNAPPGFQTQFNDRNPLSGLIGRNTLFDSGVRSGAMPNAQERHAYESLLDYVVRSGAVPNAQERHAYESLLDYLARSGAVPNAQEQRAYGSLFDSGVGSGARPNAQGHHAYDSSVEAQQRYRPNFH